mmetsp:Transcript_12947/g.34685  ORF Transcript_12947/g.34685 Transcript_12947/m.34685 type:complete len:174 (+) Transcript_12947:110-631(+)|eukprot:CAMPEP_0117570318 /NCGR_PEP_ID=MMETSP0784-20121206/59133_1 /TAXON_ID=39447 /ORGANISM="" /LENGTH=173 /DNA_ID=CAMNT_0005368361 /DNA_START=40 /DNA_END=561 /DNA_ORIENTATION=+
MGQASSCDCDDRNVPPEQVVEEGARQIVDTVPSIDPEPVLSPQQDEEPDPELELVRQSSTYDAKADLEWSGEPPDAAGPAAKDAVEPQAELIFARAGHDDKVVVFKQTPLGIDFHRKVPLVIKKVIPGGFADAMGLGSGWVLTAVNGEDIKSMEFDGAVRVIQAACDQIGSAR